METLIELTECSLCNRNLDNVPITGNGKLCKHCHRFTPTGANHKTRNKNLKGGINKMSDKIKKSKKEKIVKEKMTEETKEPKKAKEPKVDSNAVIRGQNAEKVKKILLEDMKLELLEARKTADRVYSIIDKEIRGTK